MGGWKFWKFWKFWMLWMIFVEGLFWPFWKSSEGWGQSRISRISRISRKLITKKMAVLQVTPAGEMEEMFKQIGGGESIEQRVMWREIRALFVDDWQDVERGDDFLQLVGRQLRIGLAGQCQRVEPWAEVVERECLAEDGTLCRDIVCDEKVA